MCLTFCPSCVGVYLCICTCVYSCTCPEVQSDYFPSVFAAGDSQAAPDNGGCFCYAGKLLTFHSYRPSIHLPSLRSISLTLSNTLSPPEHRCICPFPSQWRKHKTKPIKISCDKGFFFFFSDMNAFVCQPLLCCGHVCVSTYHQCVLYWICTQVVLPSTCVFAPIHHFNFN